jgi:hypothetical protein
MDYCKRYWRVFGTGLRKSTGEQVIGALLAVVIVICQIHYGLITEVQVNGAYWSIAWPYAILVGGLLLWHLVKTPAEIDAAITSELVSSKSREESLATKLREIEDARPRITLRNPYTEKVGVNQNGTFAFAANVLRVKLENTSQNHYPNNEAKGVTTQISFYDSLGNLLIPDMDGRWADSTQPVGPHWQSIVPLLATDFRIGAKHDVDIVFRDLTFPERDTEIVALNNDNFRFPRWRNPGHILVGERFVAKICISAVWVNTEFSVEFWALPHGEIGFCLVTQP